MTQRVAGTGRRATNPATVGEGPIRPSPMSLWPGCGSEPE